MLICANAIVWGNHAIGTADGSAIGWGNTDALTADTVVWGTLQ